MAKLTPEQAAAKLIRNAKSAASTMAEQVDKVTVAPSQQAVAKQEKMLRNLMEAIQSGKWAESLGSVTLEDWKEAMKTKGIPRIAQGLDASESKLVDFYAELFPYQEGIQRELAEMPDLTFEDALSRMVHNARKMKEFKRRKR
jgi:hypothetical protein